MKMKSLCDHWTYAIDRLGYEGFARRVREMIFHAETPLSISIGGRWGSGKTSVLRAVMRAMGGHDLRSRPGAEQREEHTVGDLPDGLALRDDEKKRVWPIWFNPWLYQSEPNPMIPLLHEIREQIRFVVRARDGVRDLTVDTLDVVTHSLGHLIDNAANLVLGKRIVDLGSRVVERAEAVDWRRREQTFADPVDAQRFHLEFEAAVAKVVGTDGRLVVFIDDLDRCGDATIYGLLEAIKLYLWSRHCVFVLGVDRTHVESAVASAGRYSLEEARRYVEKLFQVRLNLPRPSEEILGRYVTDLLGELLGEDLAESHGPLLARFLPPNPRAIKQLLNSLCLYRDLVPHTDDDDRELRIALVQLFRTYHPDAYELLLQAPGEYFPHLLEILKGGSVDPANSLLVYLDRATENPMQRSAATGIGSSSPEEQAEGKSNRVHLADERYREMRAGVWRAKALSELHGELLDRFSRVEQILPYLL